MAGLLERIIAIFSAPAGMTVLGLAGLAFLGLVIAVFWDRIKVPRRDEASERGFQTAPPPLLSPQLVGRSAEGGWRGRRMPVLRNAFLLAIGAGFIFGGVKLAGELSAQGAEHAEARLSIGVKAPAQVTPVEAQAASPEADHLAPPIIAYCEERGSVADRFVEVCAQGASVRFDLLRLSQGGRFLLRPVWAEAAPTFVGSDSHAAPISLDAGVVFAGPETVGAPRYDGYLVIGSARREAGAEVLERARARAEALRDFAVAALSGGDRSECTSQERVYAYAALFDDGVLEDLEAEKVRVRGLAEAAKRGDAKALSDLPEAEGRLRRRELDVTDAPAPIVIGITADPMSSDPDADMQAAARELLSRYGRSLQVTGASRLGATRACTRGEAAL